MNDGAGPGFNAPEGTVRISLANLNEEDYVEIEEGSMNFYLSIGKNTK